MQENQLQLDDTTLYKLAMELKQHIEKTREEMNKYFTSLFTAVLSAAPLAASFRPKQLTLLFEQGTVWVLFSILASVGLVLALSWVLALNRIYRHGEGLNLFLISLEKKNNQSFMTFVDDYLKRVHSPNMVTKNQLMVPYTFMFIFLLGLLSSVSMLILS